MCSRINEYISVTSRKENIVGILTLRCDMHRNIVSYDAAASKKENIERILRLGL